jgi:hypothetical protein
LGVGEEEGLAAGAFEGLHTGWTEWGSWQLRAGKRMGNREWEMRHDEIRRWVVCGGAGTGPLIKVWDRVR